MGSGRGSFARTVSGGPRGAGSQSAEAAAIASGLMRPARLWVVAWLSVLLIGASGCARKPPPLVTRPTVTPGPIVVHDVAVFDGLSLAVSPPRDVLIENGRIARIAPAGSIAGGGRMFLDGRGRTLMPGLIDVHGHVANASAPPWMGAWPDPERNLQRYLYAGVTTVFDPADMAPAAFERRDAVRDGRLLGPRILAAGPVFTAPGGHPVAAARAMLPWWLRWYVVSHMTREIRTAEQAQAAIAALAPFHPSAIKVAVDAIPLAEPVFEGALLRAVVEAARGAGLRTVAHVGTVADALAAADAGAAAWMHGVYKERIPDELIPRFAAAGIPCVATITVFDSYADLIEGKREASALERESVPSEILDAFTPVPAGYDLRPFEEYFELLTTTRAARRDNVRRLHAAGVTILAGSDAQPGVFPGPGLHRELAALVESGLSPAQALRAATGDAARFVTASDDPEYGIVAEGKIADLVLVDGDPTVDITATSRISAVLQGGAPLERHPLRR